ncbi:hypothetical protein DsansV1_C41g0237621 [Dioscorea sansibarensis]
MGTTTDFEITCVTSQAIFEANAKVGFILYSKWITSLGSPIPHHNGGLIRGRFHGQPFYVLDFTYRS